MGEQGAGPERHTEKIYPPHIEVLAKALELEHRIQYLEEALFENNSALRVVETSLFIDAPFHKTAVIIGKPEHPERMFSHEAWAGWLEARLFAREYGDQELSIDFMIALNQRLLARSNPAHAGVFRNDTAWGGIFRNDRLVPIVCTPEQIQVVRENPLLDFHAAHPNDPEYGFIHYSLPVKDIEGQLQLLCDTYNQARADSQHDPYDLAAQIQRHFISIHPFQSNGRESRILMNWILENMGYAPSAPADFDMDILVTQKAWALLVIEGSRQTMLSQAQQGETNPVKLLGLEEARRRYDSGNPRYTSRTPKILSYGAEHDRLRYETFVGIAEAKIFTKLLQRPRVLDRPRITTSTTPENSVMSRQPNF